MLRIKFFNTFFFFLFPFILLAQFNLKGKIIGYPSKKIIIKKYNGPFQEVLVEVFSDQKGEFSTKIDFYEGVLDIELENLEEKVKTFSMLSDGEDINFELNIDNLGKITFLKNNINKEAQRAKEVQLKMEALKQTQQLYNTIDRYSFFHKCIQKEKKSLEKLHAKKSEFLKYYLNLESFINEIRKNSQNNLNLISARKKILKIFKEDGLYLETSGKFMSLLIHYINLSQFEYKSANEKIKLEEDEVKKELDYFINQVGYETPRGQLILLGFIDLFDKLFGKKDFLDFLISKSKSCKCELSPKLNQRIQAYESLQVGKIAPEIRFENLIYGRFDKLSQIPSKYTILFFWFSWCKHCKTSLIQINQQHDFLKRKKAEVIGILLDEDKENVLSQIIDRKWYNHKDHLGKTQKAYDVSATPTFYLLDREKKIIIKSHSFEEVINLIKQ